jgi:hypothetical protein
MKRANGLDAGRPNVRGHGLASAEALPMAAGFACVLVYSTGTLPPILLSMQARARNPDDDQR